MRALPALLVLCALAAAGCASPGDDAATAGADDDDDATTAAAAAPPLGLAGEDCMEGGGHSVHPKSLWERGMVRVVPDPWVPADVIGDVGPQVAYSEYPDPLDPVPREGNTMGNMHATMWCASWTLDGVPKSDLLFGWVGMKVERPDWSDDLPTHHYVVTVIAVNDEDVYERLHAAGFAAMHARAAKTELPDGTLRIQMWTDGNGDYDSVFKPKAFGEMTASHVRLWFQKDAAGHGEHAAERGAADEGPEGYQPIALDLLSTGGEHRIAEGQGYFSHSGTEHHAPLPGAYGKTAALMYDGFDRAFVFGPQPDVRLPEAYWH